MIQVIGKLELPVQGVKFLWKGLYCAWQGLSCAGACREAPTQAASEVWVPLWEQGVGPALQGMSCASAGQPLLRLELSVQLLEEFPTRVRVVPALSVSR